MDKMHTPFGELDRLPIEDSPMDMARRFQARRGFVFLDSGVATKDALSVVAFEPEREWKGSIFSFDDKKNLRAALNALGSCGGLFGSIHFDGSFSFGTYKNILVYRHADRVWGGTSLPTNVKASVTPPPFSIDPFHPLVSREEFIASVQRVKDYIAAGDIYQVCLSYPWEAKFSGNPWTFYEKLRHHSPAPHAAFLRTSTEVVASASPETFLKMHGRHIITKPIKGTRPRATDPKQDADFARELKVSHKENAELLMITDLERNDLGQICDYHSVHVSSLNALEHFAQVHHLVSTVEGRLREEVTHIDALSACFPGGSISGAPKRRALEIIRALEKYPRGLYTGAIGYLGVHEESQFSIAIRTAEFASGIARYFSGGGIVIDSDPEAEWEETRIKARSLPHFSYEDACLNV